MALEPGTRLGPYEILALLGAGGMGEVYKGRDVRLDRLVALKLLAPHLAANREARERFEREATTVAKLKHAHICLLYDIGKDAGRDYLVFEYLEGETLSQRLAKGPMPLDHVLQYAVEIADALDKAHRAGVTHRDIKPGNIMVVPSSETASKTETKLLDFGLAKLKQDVVKATIPPSELPTVPGALTQGGTILGTLHYMAPEQLESKEVDGRADIFSFGAVVHEMATGKKAFPGETQASIIAKILDHAPPPVSSLEPPGKLSPPALDRIVEKCLRKDREDRWQSARDVTDELKWIKEGGAEGRSLTVAARIAPQWLGWAAAAILLISTAVVSLVHFRETPPEVRPARFFVLPPEKTNFSTAGPAFLSVSPDGARLAFVATSVSGANPQLWVRPLDSLSAQPLPGTEGAFQPFWSPDSRFLAFVAQGKLKKIDVTGGPPQVLCDAAGGGGSGAWNREGVILFTPESGGVGPIYRVSAAGGAATAITTPDASQGERGHLWPHFLPDGKHFLYLALNKSTEKSAIRVGSLDSKDSKVLLNAHSFVRYAPPGPPSVGLGPQDGYLLFQRDGTLMAQAFDADALELAGEAFPIAEKVQVNPSNGRVALGVSENGVLAYRSTGNLNTQLAWFDRSGKELSRIGEPGGTISPKLSPDEKQVAVTRATDIGVSGDIWVLDLSRSTQTRLTFDAADDSAPIWSPDGSRIAFASTRGNAFGLYQKNSNGIGEEELLVKTSDSAIPEDWSLDGRFLVYLTTGRGGRDVSVLPLSGERKPAPFLQGPFYERHAQLSPDGRWMAYASDESGQYQIYVQSFPAGGGKWQVSTTGGSQPRWRHDGKELFYIALDGKLMSVPVRAGATFEAGTPVPLFQTQIFGLGVGQLYSQQYDVTADGQRFLLNVDLTEATAAPITVVLNWQAGISK